jgi:hypothetical protein
MQNWPPGPAPQKIHEFWSHLTDEERVKFVDVVFTRERHSHKKWKYSAESIVRCIREADDVPEELQFSETTLKLWRRDAG